MLSKLQDAGSARAVLAPLSGNVQGALQPAAQGAVCKTPPALRPAPPGAGGVLSEVELERLELDRCVRGPWPPAWYRLRGLCAEAGL